MAGTRSILTPGAIVGGLGSAISEFKSRENHPARHIFINMRIYQDLKTLYCSFFRIGLAGFPKAI